MAGNFGSSNADDEVISGINITPMVDVVLVLLIIFMITAPTIFHSTIQVELPRASTGVSAQKSPFQIAINREGNLFLDGAPIDLPALEDKLKKSGDLSEQTAIIQADTHSEHGTVVHVMDTLRKNGLTRFALEVQ